MSKLGWGLLIVGFILGGILPPIMPTTSAQIDAPPIPFVDNPLTDHPRLLITPAYIEQTLRPRATVSTDNWVRLQTYVDSQQPEQDVLEYPEQVTRSLAIAYWMTDDIRYARRAQVGLLQMVDRLSSHPALTSNAFWDEQFLDDVAGVAIAYDWLHPTLNEIDRAALREVLEQAAVVLNNPEQDNGRAYRLTPDGNYSFVSYEHWGARMLWAITATGLALLGESSEAQNLIDYSRALLEGWMIPSLNELTGGAWAEGTDPNLRSGWALAQTATAFWTALGENYFTESRWWYDRMAYNMFAYHPEQTTVTDANLPVWDMPNIIGASPRNSDGLLLGRAQDMLLNTVYTGTEISAWMTWFLEQGTPPPILERWMAVEEFLWRDELAIGFPPPWRMWFTLNTGHVFLRSSWDFSEPPTAISFYAGDRFSGSQFFDQGHLSIWRGDELIVRSGVYSGGINTDHDANYYMRTVAANTPIICDLSEVFDDIWPNLETNSWRNDCGQRSMAPASNGAVNPFQRATATTLYETGTVLRFSEEGSMHYFRANLTPAYNSTYYTTPDNRAKVDDVLREFVFLRPDILLVHDRILTTNAEFVPLTLFHVNSIPQERLTWYGLTEDNGTLWMQGLAPQNRGQIIEGYQVEAVNIPQAIFNDTETEDVGLYRVQFIPTTQQLDHHFLTVFAIGRPAPPPTQYIDGNGVYGAVIDDWQIMFDDDPGNITRTDFAVQDGVINLLITGLTPLGEYRVTLPNGRAANLLADDAGTLFIFIEQSGTIRLVER